MIESLASYIETVVSKVEKLKFEFPENIIVFRGQNNKLYSLEPSLYRESRESYFEYDVIHFLKSSKFVDETSDLDIAIHAQHFGYPTRLLDVTYNSLVALFFSCYDPNSKNEDNDGLVSIISIPRFFPPTSTELLKLYTDCIKYTDLFNLYNFFESPILIENIKNNDRIIAQQGAFLMFLNKKQNISNHESIIIKSKLKSKLLDDLNEVLNINEGSIFPDIQRNISTFNIKNSKNRYLGSINTDILKSIKLRIIEDIIDECNDCILNTNLNSRSECIQKSTLLDRYKRKLVNNLNKLIPNELEEKRFYLQIIDEKIEGAKK